VNARVPGCRCLGPALDCACEARVDPDPPRLAPGDPAYVAVVLFAEDAAADETWLDQAEVKVGERVRAFAAKKGGR
jgi:hypothetical protein